MNLRNDLTLITESYGDLLYEIMYIDRIVGYKYDNGLITEEEANLTIEMVAGYLGSWGILKNSSKHFQSFLKFSIKILNFECFFLI